MMFEFKHIYDAEKEDGFGFDEAVLIQFNAEDWMEIADKFVNFLQGCGYFVDRQRLGEYLYDESQALQGELEV